MNKHNAPSVIYPLERSRVQAAVCLALWFSGCLAVGSWTNAGPNKSLALLAGVVVLVLTGWAVFIGWKSSPTGKLAWDGQCWHWESTGYQAGLADYEVVVAADFQHILLLRLQNPAHARLWLWAERSTSPERWLDLRRAVYSPHRERVLQALAA